MTDNQDKNNNPYAVIIGGANMDICGAAIGTLISKDSNIGKIGSSSGGVARNIAENLALLSCNFIYYPLLEMILSVRLLLITLQALAYIRIISLNWKMKKLQLT